MTEWWQVGVALYAAVVATGALFLEVRRWFEGKPRLVVNANPGMTTVGPRGLGDKKYVIVTATNRGSTPTTITHLGLLDFANWWKRLRRQHGRAAVVTHPTIAGTAMGQIPFVLEPGRQWSGVLNDDDELKEWMDTGRLYVAIYATHSERALLAPLRRKPKLPESLEDAEER